MGRILWGSTEVALGAFHNSELAGIDTGAGFILFLTTNSLTQTTVSLACKMHFGKCVRTHIN